MDLWEFKANLIYKMIFRLDGETLTQKQTNKQINDKRNLYPESKDNKHGNYQTVVLLEPLRLTGFPCFITVSSAVSQRLSLGCLTLKYSKLSTWVPVLTLALWSHVLFIVLMRTVRVGAHPL